MSHICDGRDLSCASCVALARRLDTVRAAMTVDDELDDVKRARIWTRLEDRLADVGSTRGSRARIIVGVAAAAAVAAAGLFAALAPGDERHTLAVPVDTVVTSRLGPHTFASLAGPAQLDIVGVPGDATTVHLRSGTLLIDFIGGAGRSLRIEAPRATIDVVGTLFSVTTHDGVTCIAVAHGRVRITMTSGVLYVVDGQRYCTGDTFESIADDLREALTRHHERREPPARATTTAAADRRPADRPPAADAAIAEPSPGEHARAAAPTASAAASPTAPPLPSPRAPIAAAMSPSPRDPHPSASPGAPAARYPDVPRPVGPVKAPEPTERRSQPAASSPPGAMMRSSLPGASERRTPEAAAAGPPQSPLSPEELYRAAEAALAARDLATADLRLAEIIDKHSTSPLVDQALYERARIAYQQRAWPVARSHLARLATIPGARFAEQGNYLRCRVAVETQESSAMACLSGFRAAFRSSPHDLDALALLVQLAHTKGGCVGAALLVEELAETYPRTTLAAAWRARCPEPR